ncbi:MAG: DUF1499 domain-containing protein [Pseudomonadota bacterium]
MAGYVERLVEQSRETSRAAQWCQRLAVFAIPYLAIVVLGHRFGAIDTQSTFWLLGLGVLILLVALMTGVRGLYELWTYGNQGGIRSARGIALSLILLLPFIWFGAKAFTLPPLYDVSTDLEDPPEFDTALDDRASATNPIEPFNDVTRDLQLIHYPQIAARRYPLGVARVFRTVVLTIREQNWTVLTANTEQGQAPIDEEGSGLVAKPTTDGNGVPLRPATPARRPIQISPAAEDEDIPAFDAIQVSPTGRSGGDDEEENENAEERYVEAVATTLIFGFESDVVVRLVEEEDGTLVDMRSTSRFGPHDLGSNAARIVSFMQELDTVLQGLGEGR